MKILYRGVTNAWECDEMGHLNVRFYVAKAMEGLGPLAEMLGMSGAFREDANGTLQPIEQHIRFHAESRPGTPLTISGAPSAVGSPELTLYQEMRHTHTGALSATLQTRLGHVLARSNAAFPFPERTISRAKALMLAGGVPEAGAPRSLAFANGESPVGDFLRPEAPAGGDWNPLGCFMVSPAECDIFGWLRAEMIMGRVSDSVPNLMEGWRRDLASALDRESGETSAVPRRIGAAVLETRIHYHAWPRAGDLIETHSFIKAATSKTLHFVHRLIDPVRNIPWASVEAMAVSLDLDARKAISVPPEFLAQLNRMAVAGPESKVVTSAGAAG